VVVVDDSRVMRRIIVRMVTSMGFEPLEATDGRNAIDVIEAALLTGPVDLVLADWKMPVMDGVTLIRHLRGDSRFDRVRIVMISSETEISRIDEALAAGADEYLMKPFDQAGLADKLHLVVIDPLDSDPG
jgi:two-component system chemotaxis response regulator CheY